MVEVELSSKSKSRGRNKSNFNERNLVMFGLLCVFLVIVNRISTNNDTTGDRYLKQTLLVDLAAAPELRQAPQSQQPTKTSSLGTFTTTNVKNSQRTTTSSSQEGEEEEEKEDNSSEEKAEEEEEEPGEEEEAEEPGETEESSLEAQVNQRSQEDEDEEEHDSSSSEIIKDALEKQNNNRKEDYSLEDSPSQKNQKYPQLPPSQSPPVQSSQSQQQQQQSQQSQSKKNILVVYAGPTSLFDEELVNNPQNITAKLVKSYEYHLNFEYFLKYGINCNVQDTLLVVTEEVYPHYKSRVEQMNKQCQHRKNGGGRVILMTRENKCLDLEAVRVATQDSYKVGINITSYDFFFYINCGVSGPSRHLWENNIPWTSLLLPRIRDKVKMTGLTLNCMGTKHIQSMMYGMDQEALQLILKEGVIFDCLERNPDFYKKDRMKQHGEIVVQYERAMGRVLLANGYGLDAGLVSSNDTLNRPVFGHNASNCTAKGMWIGDRLRSKYNGRIPLLNETIFFKSTRYMSPELAEEIGYKAKIYKGLNW